MRQTITIALLAASAFIVACGDSDNDRPTGPSASLDAGDIVVDLNRDVRDNLASHFSTAAAKLPNRVAEIRFDFSETSRTVAGDDGVVTGDFIFYAAGDLVQKGSIAIFYRPGSTAWFRTGLFDVSDQATADVHQLTITVTDATTLRPVVGAEVEARHIGGLRSSKRIFTDSEGHATVEVLPGVFTVGVSRDDYNATTTDNITTVGVKDQTLNIALVRGKDYVRSL
ncbi:MAG: carboxypeptidase regulatory-like domain-containing protein [Gemmatimonadetes bacterium]|jgi:hypothetical protein|nr:carboxypeptidase regulatory-like domain-containing protein [Gemmatimonadota bacterium]MBT6143794.1 carboxypeptidase regulatory-like domain-containing protein [Gemmatimonadota bacterium]MBT7861051.1 carboxypeptidase regulatory-like domain-containing protein [Gemmatimonadota bacterium]